MNKKFPPQEHINFHEQIINYFATIRKLPNMGLNPKLSIINEHVTIFNIEKVLGQIVLVLKQQTYIYTWIIRESQSNFLANIWIDPHHKQRICRLGCERLHRMLKGHLVNCAMVIASTTKEKAHRQTSKRVQKWIDKSI